MCKVEIFGKLELGYLVIYWRKKIWNRVYRIFKATETTIVYLNCILFPFSNIEPYRV